MEAYLWGRGSLFRSILALISHSNKPPLLRGGCGGVELQPGGRAAAHVAAPFELPDLAPRGGARGTALPPYQAQRTADRRRALTLGGSAGSLGSRRANGERGSPRRPGRGRAADGGVRAVGCQSGIATHFAGFR